MLLTMPQKKLVLLMEKMLLGLISSAVQSTRYLRRVLPIGVIVGSSLAALRKYFHLSTIHDDDQSEVTASGKTKISRKRNHKKTSIMEINQIPVYKTGQNGTFHSPTSKKGVETGVKSLNKDGVMVVLLQTYSCSGSVSFVGAKHLYVFLSTSIYMFFRWLSKPQAWFSKG